ncbi:MAG: response regulator [Vicinamibacterales bacterium]
MRPRRSALVVDADPMVRLAVDTQLEDLGWEAFPASGGEEAIGLLDAHGHFDAVLIDIRLHDANAREIAALIAALAPSALVVFMAPGVPIEPTGTPILVKPFSTSALARVLSARIPFH